MSLRVTEYEKRTYLLCFFIALSSWDGSVFLVLILLKALNFANKVLMHKNNRRYINEKTIVIVLMLVLLLSGCVGNGAEDKSGVSQEPTATVAKETTAATEEEKQTKEASVQDQAQKKNSERLLIIRKEPYKMYLRSKI